MILKNGLSSNLCAKINHIAISCEFFMVKCSQRLKISMRSCYRPYVKAQSRFHKNKFAKLSLLLFK